MPEITSGEILNAIVILSLVIGGWRMYFVGKRQGRAEYEREIEEIAKTVDMEGVLPALNSIMGLLASKHIEFRSSGDQRRDP
jgi:hypothetical protein